MAIDSRAVPHYGERNGVSFLFSDLGIAGSLRGCLNINMQNTAAIETRGASFADDHGVVVGVNDGGASGDFRRDCSTPVRAMRRTGNATFDRQTPYRARPERNDSDVLLLLAVGVELLEALVHVLCPARSQVIVGQVEVGNIHRYLVNLVEIAHVGGKVNADVGIGSARITDSLSAVLNQRCESRPQVVKSNGAEAARMRQGEVMLQVGRHHAECGEDGASGRYDYATYANLPRYPGRNKTGSATKAHERKLAGIESAAHGRESNAFSNGTGYDTENALRGFFDGQTQRPGNLRADCLCREVDVQFNRAAKELFDVKQAKNKRGIRNGGLRASATVTSGARVRARARWTDAQNATFVHASDAAAASAERVYVNGGDGYLPAGLKLLAGDVRAAVLDECDVGACAAHVEGNYAPFSKLAGDMRRSRRTAGRPGKYGPDGLLRAVLDGSDASVRLNDEQGRRTPDLRDAGVKPLQIIRQRWAYISVQGGGGKTVELLYLGQNDMRSGDVSVRQHLPNDSLRFRLMFRIEERKQEAYCHRIHALGLQVLYLPLQPVYIQIAPDLATGVNSLRNADTKESWR